MKLAVGFRTAKVKLHQTIVDCQISFHQLFKSNFYNYILPDITTTNISGHTVYS